MTRQLLQEIESANKRHRFLQKNDSLVVAVSGGSDSVALLWLLLKLRKKYSLKIAVAHLDHGFFPKESKRFLSFVQKISRRLNLPLYSKNVPVRQLAKKRNESLEEAGRNERYKFFEEIAVKLKAKIVTAHTLDDQAETLLMRIFRGTGLKGLAGIPAKRKQGRCEIIRPLLDCQKKNLLAFLKENHIQHCADKSNKSGRFTRNRIRNNFLPKISRQFNPNIKQNLSSLSVICSDAQDFLEKASEQAKISQLKKLHPAVAREVLRRTLPLGSVHIEAILGILHSPEKKELHLPGSIIVRKSGSRLTFSHRIAS